VFKECAKAGKGNRCRDSHVTVLRLKFSPVGGEAVGDGVSFVWAASAAGFRAKVDDGMLVLPNPKFAAEWRHSTAPT
jgi:hypothetical protein